MQPLVLVKGVMRFKENAIVRRLLDESTKRGYSLNEIARDGICLETFSQADWEQFYQLIGYSLGGYHELSQVSDESALEATEAAKKVSPEAAGCRDIGCGMHIGVKRERRKK